MIKIKRFDNKIKLGLDFDDCIIDTIKRIKDYFKETYNAEITDRTNFAFSSMIKGFTDVEISNIIWELDSDKIFDADKIEFINGINPFLDWCANNRIFVTVQTANPFHDFVYDCLKKLPMSSMVAFDLSRPVIFTWKKHELQNSIVIDDDERFIERELIENPDVLTILLTKKHYQYKKLYPFMEKDYEDIKEVIMEHL